MESIWELENIHSQLAISWDSHQNRRLHTGARVIVVVTYFSYVFTIESVEIPRLIHPSLLLHSTGWSLWTARIYTLEPMDFSLSSTRNGPSTKRVKIEGESYRLVEEARDMDFKCDVRSKGWSVKKNDSNESLSVCMFTLSNSWPYSGPVGQTKNLYANISKQLSTSSYNRVHFPTHPCPVACVAIIRIQFQNLTIGIALTCLPGHVNYIRIWQCHGCVWK